MTKRKKWGIFLLAGPFVLLIANALLQLILRFTLQSADGGGGEGPVELIVNIISVIIGMVAVVGLVPGIIIGIILLATPEKDKTA